MLNKTGVPSKDSVKSCFPDAKILLRPKAIIECYEEIPCNPCSTSCPVNAITIGQDINERPQLNVDLCTGCAICVFHCPGLAIVVAQLKEDKAWFKVPYELLPLPIKGEVWYGVNRSGEIICDARIENVLLSSKSDRTAVVTLSIDKDYLYDFITIRAK